MYYIFYRTNDVFKAEELCQNVGLIYDIVPTPVQDKGYCGICIKSNADQMKMGKALRTLEYKVFKSKMRGCL